jgi:hypothetical protein
MAPRPVNFPAFRALSKIRSGFEHEIGYIAESCAFLDGTQHRVANAASGERANVVRPEIQGRKEFLQLLEGVVVSDEDEPSDVSPLFRAGYRDQMLGKKRFDVAAILEMLDSGI